MGRSYKQCTECGKQALGIATRCPACGHELLSPAVPEGLPARGPGRSLSPGLGAGVVAIAAVLLVATLGRARGTPGQRSSAVAVDAMASTELGYALPTTALLDTASVTTSRAKGAGKLLVTRTWTNVRQSRSGIADVEAVLLPGDTVLADSLARGWYRVSLEGEVLGYAHRSTLTAPSN